MKNKKNFNNIFDSICLTLLLVFSIIIYCIIVWLGLAHLKESINKAIFIILCALFFGAMLIINIILIINGCYEYWVLTEDCIYNKKLFRKRIKIIIDEIDKVERVVVPAIILGLYKSNAYVVYSKGYKITILIKTGEVFTILYNKIEKYIR